MSETSTRPTPPEEPGEWYYTDARGARKGPIALSALQELVVEGEVRADTPVSKDGKAWRAAAGWRDLGFDCLVLQAEGELNVLGPFAREYLDRPDAMEGVAPDSAIYVRSGTVGEAAAGETPFGRTGAALVERILAAGAALRKSEKARREAEASLRAKDLEFEAERQRLSAEISSLKAAGLRMASETEALRAEAEARTAAERRGLDAEARLVDAEKAVASRDAALRKAQERAQAAEGELSAARREAADGRDAAAKAAAAADEAREARRAAESERDAARSEAAALAKDLEAARAEAAGLARELDAARAFAKAAGEGFERLRGRLSDALAEAAASVPAEPVPDPVPPRPAAAGPIPEAEFVAAEPAAEPPAGPAPAAEGGEPGAKVDVVPARPAERRSRMAALEDQLKRELSMVAGTPRAAKAKSRSGFINVFKK